ncbi:hypothetical protein EUGRSUZ_E03936 [Eucalyptus grandis]|uniref:Uncharacterized protein n=2 Tax=Eucalyptus grandis TaxID=71139 RepID=A0ACC3L1I3_EUCGR|nr:hypothetical protein EUGRSUZ_E03936 [Eucalyptus grandis]
MEATSWGHHQFKKSVSTPQTYTLVTVLRRFTGRSRTLMREIFLDANIRCSHPPKLIITCQGSSARKKMRKYTIFSM